MTPGPAPPPIGRARLEPDTLAPDGSEIRLLATAQEGASRAGLCEVRIPPGAVSRPVRHRSVEEIWHVTGGRGRVWRCAPGARAEPVEVGPGDTLVIPAGWAFQFSAADGAALRLSLLHVPGLARGRGGAPGRPGGHRAADALSYFTAPAVSPET